MEPHMPAMELQQLPTCSPFVSSVLYPPTPRIILEYIANISLHLQVTRTLHLYTTILLFSHLTKFTKIL